VKVAVASMDTEKFTFTGYGSTTAEARAALGRGLVAHGKQYNLPERWWYGHYDTQQAEFELGGCYRDEFKIA
jgi:hypothetical protein